MISYKQYLKLLKNKIKIDNEKIKSDEACNRISAKKIISPTNYPSSNNAILMDLLLIPEKQIS